MWLPSKWMPEGHPKCPYLYAILHDVISQKTEIFLEHRDFITLRFVLYVIKIIG